MAEDGDELRERRLALAALLGARLVALGLDRHAQHLRAYYRRVRGGREPEPDAWSHAHVIRLAQNLQVPPHDHDLPVRAHEEGCRCASPKTYTGGTWPGGARIVCAGCREEWIVLHAR